MVHSVFHNFPILYTPRLELRGLNISQDVEAVYEIYRHPAVMRYYPDSAFGHRRRAADLIHYFRSGYAQQNLLWWAATLLENGQMIGTLGLYQLDFDACHAETGFDLHPQWWGQGYMSEALRAVLAFGFYALALRHIMARTMPSNTPSRRLLERMGFEDCGALAANQSPNNSPFRVQFYQLREEHFHVE